MVNKLAANLTNQVRSIAKVTKAVALGDLSKQIEVDARGEILELKNTVNGMVVRLRALAAEVTRVTLEVGFKGKLGGQAHVPDVEGVWLELTRNVGCSAAYFCYIFSFFLAFFMTGKLGEHPGIPDVFGVIASGFETSYGVKMPASTLPLASYACKDGLLAGRSGQI